MFQQASGIPVVHVCMWCGSIHAPRRAFFSSCYPLMHAWYSSLPHVPQRGGLLSCCEFRMSNLLQSLGFLPLQSTFCIGLFPLSNTLFPTILVSLVLLP